MARTAKDITEAELAVMRRLWDGGAATIRQLAEVLYGAGSASQYATVQKLLERLEDKGFVRRDRSASPQEFAAAVDRGQLIGRRLRSVAEELCGGSMTPLLSHLVRHQRLSADERRSLRELIDELDRERRR